MSKTVQNTPVGKLAVGEIGIYPRMMSASAAKAVRAARKLHKDRRYTMRQLETGGLAVERLEDRIDATA